MNGGMQTAERWTPRERDDDDASEMPFDDDGAEFVPSADWRVRMAAILAVLAALAWLGLAAASKRDLLRTGITFDSAVEFVTLVVPPLVLIALLYLLAVRTSRSEAARLAQVSGGLRSEQARLEAVLASVGTRLASERADIAEHADRLLTIGDEAATRLRAVGDTLRRDIDALLHQAEALRGSAGAARSDVSSLLSDLPKAHAETSAMTATLDQAGLVAHEHVAALDAQVASLVARGREADDVVGGAAQKLSAQLGRIEGVSASAGARLVESAETMTGAIDAALERAASASEASRRAMDAQGTAMLALVEQSEAALTRTGQDATEAVAARVAETTARIDALGAMLDAQRAAATATLGEVGNGIDAIDARFAAIDDGTIARNERLSTTLAALAEQAGVLGATLDTGATSASAMIGRVETLMTALDGVAHEIGIDLPAAMERLDTRSNTTQTKLAQLSPQVAGVEAVAAGALDRLLEAEALLAKQQAALDALGGTLDARLTASTMAATDLVAAVEGADARSRAIAEGAGAQLVEAMVRVRETAQAAADRARETIAAVVPASAERLGDAVRTAMSETVANEVEAQIARLTATAERAVAAAGTASDRLMRQMLTIAETSAQVEARIGEAHAEIEAADSDTFARRVALLIESLNSTAIDVTKILSNDVTDSAWGAYLKGDRGVFTRRAVRLLDAGEVREIARHYNEDSGFREQVNRYVHDFEAMLRNVLATRSGSPLVVTLLSSDMGKLYVALAQAIERLRS